MKNFIIISAISLLLFLSSIEAQINIAPLKHDNVWVYGPDPGRVRVSIVDTNTVIDSIIYYTVWEDNVSSSWEYYMRLKTDDYYAIRLETTYPTPNNELLYYKKDATIGDTWTVPDPFSPFDAVYTIEDTLVLNLFGEPTTVKYLTIDSGILLFEEYWTEKFGILSRYQNAGGQWVQWTLMGCVIDGIVYGDTSFTVVSVKNEFDLPEIFALKQNYPNPFNSSTVIRFVIPESDYVLLEVYNSLGEKIKTLINEFTNVGNHSIRFEAGNLASGVYLYFLRTSGFIGTKKMLLIR